MNRLAPTLLLLAASLTLAPLAAPADEGGSCTCREGRACYHFLEAPVSAPDDPCHCPQCRVAKGTCPKRVPPGWDPTCASNNRMSCFLRRHAASWDLTCSVMLERPECECRNPRPEWCPSCGVSGEDWRSATDLLAIKRQIEVERELLGRRAKFVVVTSPNFYVVTDIKRMKLETQSGPPRKMEMHEIAHLYAQRAEIAREDFVRVFGDRLWKDTRLAIYLLRRESMQDDVAQKYLSLDEFDFTYGSYQTRNVAGGYTMDGLAISLDENPGDHDLHLKMRHNLGHLLLSRWMPTGGKSEVWPAWVYRGSAHWLSRLPEKFRERARFHHGEGDVRIDSGAHWWKKLRVMALQQDLTPMQRFLDMGHRDQMSLEDHRRVWSWFELFLAEDRERFLEFLTEMRRGREGRPSLETAFGCTPEELDQRWRDRVLHRRESIAATVEELDAANPDDPGAQLREGLREEKDPDVLAARVRALEKVDDPLTAATLVPLLAHPSEKVRESVVLLLSKAPGGDVRAWLRGAGLAAESAACRAGVARILGQIPDREAGVPLTARLADGDWRTRAEVARALGRVRHADALRGLQARLSDSSPMVRIAAVSAIGSFGRRAGFAWESAAALLSDSTWQVRSATAECLGALGELAAVDPLLDRMKIEGGRIRMDIRAALKRLTGDDLGADPEVWSDWWEKEKERHGGVPPRDAMGRPPRPEDENYAPPPTYYGIRVFSQRIAYLIDASGSMLQEISIDPDWMKRHRREYPSRGEKFELAAHEVERSLRSLDPRTGFEILFFSSRADSTKDGLVQATPANVDRGLSRLRASRPAKFSGSGSMTNYVDAIRLLLDMREGEDLPDRPRQTADTAFFLTDGYPTAGDLTDPELLLAWFTNLNDFARIHFHVITFGDVSSDGTFLKALAEKNGGTYLMIPGVR